MAEDNFILDYVDYGNRDKKVWLVISFDDGGALICIAQIEEEWLV